VTGIRVLFPGGTGVISSACARAAAEAGFVPLLGRARTLGEPFHITSDDVLTWNQIAETLAAAAGCAADIVHVPSDEIAAADPEWGAGLLGDKAHSLVFDNSKLRSVVPGYPGSHPV
jgi:nucleoside-diphosphate-sugar epimerase